MKTTSLVFTYLMVFTLIYYAVEIYNVDAAKIVKENSTLKERVEFLEQENEKLKQEIFELSQKVVTVDTYKYLFIFSVTVLLIILYIAHKRNGKMES